MQLQHSVPESRLEEIYGEENYYWYLNHPLFNQHVHKQVGDWINELGSSCLDVGCGEAWLCKHVSNQVSYYGLDGSRTALQKARSQFPTRTFIYGRMESSYNLNVKADIIVFGGMLSVYTSLSHYVRLLGRYEGMCNPTHIIVHDLSTLDASKFTESYKVLHEEEVYIPIDDLQEVKKHRKLWLLEC
jgi:SAM-dependent methyltransferase